MRKPYLVLLLACALPLGLAAAESALPWYAALRTADPPAVDGELDEACWREAETTTPFVAIGGSALAVRTTGQLCWDDRTLYIAIACAEPDMARVETRIAAGQIAGFEESVEIFLDPAYARGGFVQLLLGITGERRSIAGGTDSARLQDGWTAKVKRSADHWVVELAIALAVLTDGPPTPDRVWALNLNRTRTVAPDRPPYHCWSATKVAFAEPDRFGNLVFAPYPLWLRARYTALTAGLTAEITDLIARYPRASGPLRADLGRLDGAWMEVLRALEASGADAPDGRDALRAQADRAVAHYDGFLARLRLAVVENQFR